jgi:6-phosphofructokinase 1
MLGTSRGNQDIKKMVDTLQSLNIDILFTIGGDGTLKGAHEIYNEIKKRKARIAVVGLPKTIDNDLMYIDKTFGFETAFSEAAKSIRSAHTEAECAPNGVGLVKLMGRHSGYVAAYAALSLREVNLVLIPEQKFNLEKVYEFIKKRLEKRGHVVIVVAEGAGQDNFKAKEVMHDSSGNVKLYDIGHFLVKAIKDHFAEAKTEIDLKYIDPSYMIRSAAANATDSVFTGTLGEYAADAAMAGKTGIAVGYWKGFFTHVPLDLVISHRNVISLESELWRNVLKATGQPPSLS